jgi:hypothetical protein
LVPSGILEDGFVLLLSALFLFLAVLARRGASLKRYWEIPFGFFVFTLAAFFGDGYVLAIAPGVTLDPPEAPVIRIAAAAAVTPRAKAKAA